MKKIIIFLLSSLLLAGPFITPASAEESNNYAFSTLAYLDAVVSYAVDPQVAKSNITYFDNLSHAITFYDSYDSTGIYIVSDILNEPKGTFIATYNWSVSSNLVTGNSSNNFVVPTYIKYNGVSYPLKKVSNIRYDVDIVDAYIKLFITPLADAVNYQMLIDFRFSAGEVFIPVDLSWLSLNPNGTRTFNFIGYTPTVVSVADASNADIVQAIEDMANSSSSTTNNVITAITQAGASITQTQVTTSQGVVTSVNQVQATTEQVKEAVQIMEENMSDNVASGLEEYDKREEEKLTEELDGNVQDIVDKLPLLDQQENFVNATDSIINAFSDSSMDCNFTVPAGVVTLSGTTYTFWEEQEVDLNSWFNNQYIQLLLVGFRFLIGFGMLYYMIEWINKIISLVLLEDTGLSAQEWRSEYREGVRARGYKKR